MRGEKRKLEQGTWLTGQSKKSKQERDPNIYYSTLAKLRIGARAFFNGLIAQGNPPTETLEQHTVQLNPTTDTAQLTPPFFCEDCSRSGDVRLQNISVCSYCDKHICHLNLCSRCKAGFCSSCCFPSYEDSEADPLSDHFICIGCLAWEEAFFRKRRFVVEMEGA